MCRARAKLWAYFVFSHEAERRPKPKYSPAARATWHPQNKRSHFLKKKKKKDPTVAYPRRRRHLPICMQGPVSFARAARALLRVQRRRRAAETSSSTGGAEIIVDGSVELNCRRSLEPGASIPPLLHIACAVQVHPCFFQTARGLANFTKQVTKNTSASTVTPKGSRYVNSQCRINESYHTTKCTS
jgi:hypothetical protein